MDMRKIRDSVEAWFTYEVGQESFEVKLRRFRSIEAATKVSEWTVRGKNGERTDPKRFMEFLAREVILDWKGVVENGTPVPCSYEARLELLDLLPGFSKFVSDKFTNEDSFLGGA